MEQFLWSRDGREILVMADGIIHAVPVSGSNPRQSKGGMKADPKTAFGPCWLPGGKKLAFMAQDAETTRIFLASLPGGEITELAADDANLKDWIYPSPDGKWISHVVEGFVKSRPAGTIWEVKEEDLLKGKK